MAQKHMDPTDQVPQHCTKSCAILILVNFRQADNKKSPLKNLMRLFLDESQGDALEVCAALMRVRKKSPPKSHATVP